MGTKKIHYGWWIILVGFFMMALIYANLASAQSVFIKPVTEEFGIERSQFSLMNTIASVGVIVASLYSGKLFQKFSLKKVILVSSLIVVLGLVGFAFAKNIYLFYAIAPFFGFAFAGSTNIPATILINNWFGGKKKGLAFSLAFAGSGIGGMLLVKLLGWVVLNYGWRTAYLVDAALILFIIIPLVLFIVAETPKQKGMERYGEVPSETRQAATSGFTLAEAKKTPTFWVMCISIFFISLMNTGILNHHVAYLNDIGMDMAFSTNIAALAVGVLTIGKILLGALSDKLGIRTSSLIANICFAAAVTSLLLVMKAPSFAFLYVVFFCIGGATTTVCPPLIAGKLFGEKDFGALVGILNIAVSLGVAIGPLLCSKLYDLNGSYRLAWISIIVVAILIVFTQFALLSKKTPQISSSAV